MFKKIAVTLALAASAAIPSFATPIAAGGDVVPSSLSVAGLTQVATTGLQSSSSATFSATYQTTVFRDTNNIYCSTCLDFVYYVVDRSGNPQGTIESVSMSNFDSFLTNVGYNTSSGAGSIVPNEATRSSDGQVVKFYFDPTGILPGQTAAYLIIQTNATNYTSGNWSIQDGSALPLTGFQPSNVVPEPSSLLMLGTGLLGAAGIARRRLGF